MSDTRNTAFMAQASKSETAAPATEASSYTARHTGPDTSPQKPVDWQARRIDINDITPHRVKIASGRFRNWRRLTTWPLLLFFFLTPWLTWNGNPAVHFDLNKKVFQMWDWVLWPEDLTIIIGLLAGGAFALFFVAMYAGRLWCGYACPQTTWTFLFIWLEEKIEGSRNQRRKLDQGLGSNVQKARRAIKFIAWGALSLATAITALAYFYPLQQWANDVLAGDISWMAIAWLIIIGGLTLINAGWLREKFCTDACPYSRFQSVMFDSFTRTVRYDEQRGEPRGKANPDSNQGDCVDCNLCVQVCPTNIDIRDGLQIACVDCGACIDACDQVMDKLGRARGLITYEPEQQLSFAQRWRLWGYGMAATLAAVLTLVSAFDSQPLSINIQRDRFSLYQLTPQDTITNRYVLSLHNRTADDMTVTIIDQQQTLARLGIPAGARAGQTINVERPLTRPSGKIELSIEYNGQRQAVEVSYSNPYATLAVY